MAIEAIPLLATTGFFTIAAGLIVLLIAYQQAKNKQFKNHKNLMLIAAGINGAFLIQYIARFLMGNETPFGGPDFVHYYIFIPILVIHITGAIVTIFLVLIQLTRSLRHEMKSSTGTPYFDKGYRPTHRSFGRKTFYLWAISFAGGIIIFLMLYIIY